MKKEIEIQRIRKRYLKEIVCQSRKWLVMAGIAMLILSIYNIVISWLLQTIIDIVSGDSSMTIAGWYNCNDNIFDIYSGVRDLSSGTTKIFISGDVVL